MRMIRILPLAFCTFLVVGTAQSQGIFTERGIGAEIGLDTGGDSPTTIGGGIGYVVNRLFEAGLDVARSEHSDAEEDWNYLYVTPRVRFYPVRQNDSVPVTAFVGVHYHFVSLSGDATEGASANGYGVELGATRAFTAGENLGVHPMVSLIVSKWHEEQEYDFGFGTELWEYDSTPIYVTVGAFLSAGVGGAKLYGGPLVIYSSESSDGETYTDTQFGFRVGGVLNK